MQIISYLYLTNLLPAPYSINSDLLKARTIEEDKIQEAKLELESVLSNKMRRVKEDIDKKQDIIDQQAREIYSMKEKIIDVTNSISSEKAKKTKVESKISKLSSKIRAYQLALRNCLDNIQNPDTLRQIVVNLSNGDLIASHQQALSPAGIQKSNETTLKLLEAKKYLEEIKKEEVAITKQHKKEKADAVARNARLLEKLSNKISSVAVNGNKKRIQALQDVSMA